MSLPIEIMQAMLDDELKNNPEHKKQDQQPLPDTLNATKISEQERQIFVNDKLNLISRAAEQSRKAASSLDVHALADKISDIRQQVSSLADEVPMTRRQREDFEIVKTRLWRACEELEPHRFKPVSREKK